MGTRSFLIPIVFIALTLGAAAQAWSQQEPKEFGWFDAAELSLISTAGNVEANTFGLRNTLRRKWMRATLALEVSALRAETTFTTREALGTPEDYRVREIRMNQLTAENYTLGGRYDRQMKERRTWFAGVSWERSEFSGIKNRYLGVRGVGVTWSESELSHLRTDFGITYTYQEDVVQAAGTRNAFLGAQVGIDYLTNVGASTVVTSRVVIDGNSTDTSDFRVDMTNALEVSITRRMTLKLSLQALFDNRPSLEAIPFESGEAVLVTLRSLDTVFTVALVVSD